MRLLRVTILMVFVLAFAIAEKELEIQLLLRPGKVNRRKPV